MNNRVTIYTDGSSLGNPGPGGFGIVLLSGPHRREIAEGYRLTTNNRMELLAVITALEALKRDGIDATIYSDSKYVIDSVPKGWIYSWMRKGFAGKKNADLWRRFMRVFGRHHVRFIWIKGHNNNIENERCDLLATTAAKGETLLEDTGYKADDPSVGSIL